MKYLLFCYIMLAVLVTNAQSVQLHEDLKGRFPELYIDYFKLQDSGRASFFFKMQADFSGKNNTVGKVFTQVAQTLQIRRSPLSLHLSYSGGLGQGYTLDNTYQLGLAYNLKWKGWILSNVLDARYASGPGIIYTLYWWKGLYQYKLELAGDFSVWTEQGHGYFFAEPQIWYNIKKQFAVGTKVNIFGTMANPTLAVKYKF
jgi:hypothetical protein